MDSSIGTYESAPPAAPGEPSDAVAVVLGGAVEQARRAIVEFSGETVGAYLGVTFQDEAAATHRFLAVMPGYQGWQWAVVVAACPGATHATISEVVLVPGPTALLAPPWVPWEQRVRPGDLGPGDLLAPLPDDPRLVPGFVATGDPLIDDTAVELGFGRRRVLSAFGRDTAAQRWHDGDHGPTAAMARATKRVCRDCGFMVPLSGALGGRFGVCCNELSADGEVVDFFYGCGAHSDTPAPHGSGSPAYDPFDDGVLEVVEAPVAPASAGPSLTAPDRWSPSRRGLNRRSLNRWRLNRWSLNRRGRNRRPKASRFRRQP
ncbi:MAG: DUF3027 domain-containing protein [Mycobacterium sp.]